jgi:hypothetical protein
MPVPNADSSFEVNAKGGSVAGLLFGPLPSVVGTGLKIVWRVTGSGDLKVTSERPDGSSGKLTFGPEPHGSSNFDRSGAEWGTGFLFDAAGCWHIDVVRGEVRARVPIEVRPS